MIEHERGQRDLDRKPGGQERGDAAQEPAAEAVVARAEQAANRAEIVKRDDRRDRGEAQLETRSGQRFGPHQEHRQRAHRDQPEAQRVAAKRDPGED